MDRVRRAEFLGSNIIFIILCLTGIGIPLAILYLINSTVIIEHQVDDGERLVDSLRKRHWL